MSDLGPLLSQIVELLRERNDLAKESLDRQNEASERIKETQKDSENRLEKIRERFGVPDRPDFQEMMAKTERRQEELRMKSDERDQKQDEFQRALLKELQELNANLNRMYLHQPIPHDVE